MRKSLSLLIATLFVVVACSSPQASGGPPATAGSSAQASSAQASTAAKPTELRVAMALMPKGPSLDPMLTTYGNPEFTNLYDGLTSIAQDGSVVPNLATEWTNVDPNTWQFKLRQGVKFHNGDPFTAEDVKFSLDRIKDPANKSPGTSALKFVSDIQVVDPYTVNVTTDGPVAFLPGSLGYRVKIVPSKLITGIGEEAFAAHPVGTGPYKFVEWVQDVRIVHEANEDYWAGAPAIKKITYLSAPEASTRVNMLLNDEADMIEAVLDTDVARIEADPTLKITKSPTGYTNFISINTFQKPFDDVRVRQAMNYAVDMDTIIAKVMGGNGTHVSVSNSPNVFGYDKSLAPYPYDPAKAKQLLADAGYGTGNPFPAQTIDVGQGRQPYNIDVSQAIAGYLTAVDIPTTVNVMESAAEFTKYLSAEAILIYNANNSISDTDDAFGLNFNSAQRALYWHTPEVDALLNAGKSEFDPAKRLEIYSQVSKIIFDAAPNIFLFTTTDVYASRADLNWQALPDREMPFGAATFK